MVRMGDLRVLVVEDEAMIAMLVEDMLLDLGVGAVEIAGTVQAALALVAGQRFDFAILDVNLGDALSYPVASALRERGTPFAFATGYGSGGLSSGFAGSPTLPKPFTQPELARVMADVMARKAA